MRLAVYTSLSLLAAAAVAFVLFFRVVSVSSPEESCEVIQHWGEEGGSQGDLDHPMGLAWSEGFLYVADTENGAIEKFEPDGTFVAQWTDFERPVDVAAIGEFVYVADFLTDRISKLRSDGTLVAEWGRHGSGAGEFDAPSGIAADPEGYVYVADFYNHRIQKFDDAGEFLLEWGSDGRWSGRFHYPTEIALNDRGEVFVADSFNHRIQVFDGKGRYLTKWGGIGYGLPGKWPGWFALAKAVAMDPDGDVYVADGFNRRVQKFTDQGRLRAIWDGSDSSLPALRYPAGLAVDDGGNLYVSDFFANRIWKLTCH